MPDIHPTAVVDRNAQLAHDVQIGPYTVVGPQVKIGRGCRIGSHCVIENRTSIGRFNRISHHVMLGQIPQDLKYRGESSTLEIGDYNDIRELVTVHIGTENGGGRTAIGSNNLIMVSAHIAHDCEVGDHCQMSNNVMLAGHVCLQDHVIIAGGTALQHYVTVGRYAFIGGMAAVVHDCPPFMLTNGQPARPRVLNTIGLKRHQFEDATIDHLKMASQLLYGRKVDNVAAGLEKLEKLCGEDNYVRELIEFVHRSSESAGGRYAETLRQDDKRVSSAARYRTNNTNQK